MKRNYESMLIVVPDVGDQAQTEIFAKITKKIESLGGKVLNSTVWAKERNFCFFLKSRGAEKKKYYKGCYWLLVFSLDIEKLPDLKETIRLEENILRSLILRKDEVTIDKVVA
ncbi:MAG: 30S ribosomal protein S6 [Candidatus Omnitrophota bacterium]